MSNNQKQTDTNVKLHDKCFVFLPPSGLQPGQGDASIALGSSPESCHGTCCTISQKPNELKPEGYFVMRLGLNTRTDGQTDDQRDQQTNMDDRRSVCQALCPSLSASQPVNVFYPLYSQWVPTIAEHVQHAAMPVILTAGNRQDLRLLVREVAQKVTHCVASLDL